MSVYTFFFNYNKLFIKNLKFVLRKAYPKTEWNVRIFEKKVKKWK